MEPEKTLCNEMETVSEFTYLFDRVNTGVGCEAIMTAKTKLRLDEFRECGNLLYGNRFHLSLKGAVYKSYVNTESWY